MDDLSKMLGTLGDSGSTGGLDPDKLGNLAQAVQDEGGLDDLVGKLHLRLGRRGVEQAALTRLEPPRNARSYQAAVALPTSGAQKRQRRSW